MLYPVRTAGITTIALVVLAACSSGSKPAAQPSTTTRPSSITSTSVSVPPATQPTSTTAPSSTTPPVTTPPTPTTATPSTIATGSALPTVTIGRWTGRRPLTIYFSGDAGNITSDLVWSSWNANGALARGTWHYLNCEPNCAQGTATPYPVTIKLSDPTGGHFTKLVEQTSGPHGFTQTFTAPQLGQGACANRNNNSCAFA